MHECVSHTRYPAYSDSKGETNGKSRHQITCMKYGGKEHRYYLKEKSKQG